MKKLIAILIAALMIAGLAACTGGAKEPEPTEAPTEAPTEVPTEAPTEAPTEEPTEEPDPVAKAVADYAEEFTPQLESMKALFAGVMDLACYAEGKDLVVEYKYLNKFESTPEQLRKSLDDTAESYVPMYEELSEYADSDEVAVILRYLDNDGSLILDYIVDKEYAEIASVIPSGEKFASLQEFIDSDVFREAMGDDDDEDMRTEYSVENGDTLVITYRYLMDMTDDEKTLFADLMYAALADEGDELIAEMKDLVLAAVDIDDCGIVFRVADKDGNMLTQYPAE